MNLYTVDNKGTLTLNLHKGQQRAWKSNKRFISVLAGTQAGKTSFGPWWLYREIYGKDGKGSGDYLAVTASFDLFKLKMLPEIKRVFENVLGYGKYWRGDKVVELKDPETGKFWAKYADDDMWGRIILRSAQSEGGLESATALAAWLDEAGQNKFRLEDWEAVQRRLSLSQGRALITTTLYNRGWLKNEIYDKRTDPDIDVIQFPSYVNPAFPKTEYDRAERTLPTWKLKMFYKGEFDRPEGLIYPLDEDICKIDPIPLNPEWPRYVGHDFGGTNLCALWYAEEKVNNLVTNYYLYREFLGGGKTVSEHAEHFKKESSGENIVAKVGGSLSEDQWRRDFAAAGWDIKPPPFKDVEVGITAVYGLHKQKRIKVFNTCRGYLDEIGSYSRVLDADGKPTEKIEDKEKYHRMDSERYLMSFLTHKKEPRVTWL